ncbi:ATP-dependent 6-phosphofructokinase [Telmatobacter bradus]|uniref:ATP-dependent 6-phosphofructokinase n=1 Tax=Telmatobacter bradus TaxID=474953 RepID=UPI003B435108
MKNLAVLTSGGDAPGMNAAIRAVVRTGVARGVNVFGVYQGYTGLIEANFKRLGSRDVSSIIQRGGTILGSARCMEFQTAEGRELAIRRLRGAGIDGLIVIGGNGSQTGSFALNEMGFPVVGVASTIDNDLFGSDVTIGVDTALNVALNAIDNLKVTASSHRRPLLLEVMGRKCGYLALMAGIAGGAEAIVIPEVDTDPEQLAARIQDVYDRGKPHAIVVVAEGAKYNAEGLCQQFKEKKLLQGYEFRSTVLGYIQRGATPTCSDRLLGTRLGSAAVEQILTGESGVLVGVSKGEIITTPLDIVVASKKPLDPWYLAAADMLGL